MSHNLNSLYWELYDLVNDPNLHCNNLAGQPAHADLETELRQELEQLQHLYGDKAPSSLSGDLRGYPLKFLLGLVIAGFAFIGLLQLVAVVMRPDVSAEAVKYDPVELAAVKALHNAPIDSENPPSLYQEVSYGPDASSQAWYPKKQSPILDGLIYRR